MSKSKGKSKNFFHYLLDEFVLFRRDFYFEIEAEPEIVVENLDSLRDIKLPFTGSKVKPKLTATSRGWNFELVANIQTRWVSDLSQNAKVKGEIYEQNESYVLEAQATIGGWFPCFFIILFCILTFVMFGLFIWGLKLDSKNLLDPPFLMAVLIFPISAFFFWLLMYIDRNQLYKLIESAVESAYGNDDKAQAS